MSLLVNVYKRDSAGTMVFLDPENHTQELAGFEVFRTTFYGSAMAKSLGVTLLASLAEQDVYAEGEDLAHLQNEAELILRNIKRFTPEAGVDENVLRTRTNNILEAVRRAELAQGGVAIW